MKDIRKRPYRPAPGLVPQDLIGKIYKCPECNANVEVPWLEKMEFPRQPIMHNSGNGHFVPVSFPLTCTDCGESFNANVIALENESTWSLYGDEAGRYIQDSSSISPEPLNFFCITLVGLHYSKYSRLRRRIQKIKRSIAPSLEPDSWQYHFTEIWSSKADSDKFNFRSKEDKIEHAREFARLIRKSKPELVTFNISSCLVVPTDKSKRKEHIKFQKEDVFSQSILTTLTRFRANKKSVTWIFDNIKDTTNGKKRTEGWAEECFLGLQYTRLFTWLSAGATVIPPSFEQPGSHYLSEVADFISYWVAREFEKSVKGEKPEISTSLLGKGFYQSTIANGDVHYKWDNGLPLSEFYGIDKKI